MPSRSFVLACLPAIVAVFATVACGADGPRSSGTTAAVPASSGGVASSSSSTPAGDDVVDASSTTTPIAGTAGGPTTTRRVGRASAAVAPPLATAPPAAPGDDGTPTTSAVGDGAVARALADRDICELYDAMGALEVSGRTPATFRAGMTTVLDALDAARDFVPADLAEAWAVLVRGATEVVDMLGRPDASVSSAAAVFAEPAYAAAVASTDEWMDANCG